MEAFKFKDDQKRAIISRLLQRHCVSVALGIPWEKVQWHATLIVQAYTASETRQVHHMSARACRA